MKSFRNLDVLCGPLRPLCHSEKFSDNPELHHAGRVGTKQQNKTNVVKEKENHETESN
jgi:hypothetical protein